LVVGLTVLQDEEKAAEAAGDAHEGEPATGEPAYSEAG